MDVKLTDTPEAFDLPHWRALVEADPHRHVFATPEWQRLWWEEFGAGKKLVVLTFLDPEPVGVAAVMLDLPDQGGRLRFVGGDDLTDYLGPVCAGRHLHGKIAESLLTYLSDEVEGWTWFDAKCLPVPFGFAEWLAEAADRLSLDFTIHEDEVTAVLALPDSFEAYLEGLPSKSRHELRRKTRRFAEAMPSSEIVTATEGTLNEDLASFVSMHRGSEGLKGKFMAPERATFFERVARAFQPRGMLSLDFLATEGRRIACTFSYDFDGTFYLYNSAYEPSARELSPGLVMAARLIERSIALGRRRFDFLRGKERYKFDLGAEPLPLHSVRIQRR